MRARSTYKAGVILKHRLKMRPKWRGKTHARSAKVSMERFAFADEDVDLKNGKVLETAQIKDIKVNPPIDRSIFEKW
jgi:hypothetical protein